MKLVVTGGCGFIGSHFVDYVTNLGHEVKIVDDLSTGKQENIEQSLKSKKVQLFIEDISNFDKCLSIVSDSDAVIHFAAATGVIQSMEKPIEFAKTNVIGTLNLLEICRKNKIPKFIFASTGAVYGDQKPPFNEEMTPMPISPYAISKAVAEIYCRSYSDLFGVNCTILRFSNVYGPRKSFGPYANVIPKFVRAALRNEPITIYGDGTQERDFVYVKDVAKACFHAISNNKQGVYNIATGKNTTINSLIESIEKLLNYKFQRTYAAPRKGEIKIASSSIDKAKKELLYLPQYSLSDGLSEYVEYEKSQLS